MTSSTGKLRGAISARSARGHRVPLTGLDRRGLRVLQGAVGVAAMIGLWELLRGVGMLPQVAVPSTWAVVSATINGLGNGTLSGPASHTLAAWALGLAIASVIGISLGVAIGLLKWADALTREIIDLIRPIPPVALVPVAVVFLGFALKMEVVLIVIGAVWPLLFNSRYGVQSVDPLLLDGGVSLGLSRLELVWRVILPAALPAILTGLRTAATAALILAVAAETLAVPAGLGNVITQSTTTGSVASGYAAIVLTGILGILSNALLTVVRRRVVGWSTQGFEAP